MSNNSHNFKSLTVSKASAGSGKTFTLAAYYVALLMSGESFRHILAVTFTNKATEEMKTRILGNLLAIAQGRTDDGTLDFVEKVESVMSRFGIAYPADAQQIAEAHYRAILAEYDEMRITTIDSFLQMLYAGMAQAIGMPTGAAVDLDTEHAITTAVDQLLSDHIGDYPHLQKIIADYIGSQLDADKNANVRKMLIEIAKEIYKEAVQVQEYRIVYSPEKLEEFRSKYDWKKNPSVTEAHAIFNDLKQNANLCSAEDLISMLDKGTYLGYMFKNLEESFACTTDDPFKASRVEKKMESVKAMNFLPSVPQAMQEIVYAALRELYDLLPACREAYFFSVLTSEFLYDVEILAYIRQQIDRNLEEENSQLLANASKKLSEMLSSGDGTFILEKAGIRYHHIMLDEFQDTSSLQWKNFLDLIHEVLSQESDSGCVPHTCFIVGDIKQAIYRFRNGDWHIMDSIDEDYAKIGEFFDPQADQLAKSFRSRREVVGFNVPLFRKIAEQENERVATDEVFSSGIDSKIDFSRIYAADGDDIKDFYLTREEAEEKARVRNRYQAEKEYGHEGGYVRCMFYPAVSTNKNSGTASKLLSYDAHSDRILTDMFMQIDSMLAINPSYAKEILILVRKDKEARKVIGHFRKMQEEHPALRATNIVSQSSFLLEASRSVLTLIYAMRYLFLTDNVGHKFVRTVLGSRAASVMPQLEKFDRRMPVTDMVEELIRLCLCDADGRFCAQDVTYVNCFTDRVRDFVSRYGSDGRALLTFWEDKLHGEAIDVADTGLIRIMTLHKSKGLEAKTLFIPFCDWPLEKTPVPQKIWCSVAELTDNEGRPAILPISDKKQMCEVGFGQDYKDEHENRRLDNINLLYVGLTRAADNLFIYARQKPECKPEWNDNKKCFKQFDDSKISSLTADGVSALILNACGWTLDFHRLYIRYFEETCFETDESRLEQLAEQCVLERTFGDGPHIPMPKTAETSSAGSLEGSIDKKPFSFENRPKETITISRTNDRIEFRQSQKSMLYGTQAEEHIRLGNICHDLMAHIAVIDDVASAIDGFVRAGIIDSPKLRQRIEARIAQMWQSSEMCDWFSGRWQLLLEEPLLALDDHGEVHENRMDRVMICEARSEAIVLDYKFGADVSGPALAHYQDQVRGYMRLLSRMGYQRVSGYLWLAEDNNHLHSVSLH